MKIRLTYALSEGPAIRLDGIWPSTGAAIDYAIGLGACVASAKVMP